MKKNLFLLGGQLCIILLASCRNEQILSSEKYPVKYVQIDEFFAGQNDISNVQFKTSEDIKAFIYRNMICDFGEHSNVIRLMQESEYHLYVRKLNTFFPDKKIEDGKRYLNGLSYKEIKGHDDLNYSLSYMVKNKVCCIIVADFDLSEDRKILDIPASYFKGILDSGERIYRFKKKGNFWFFVGWKSTWSS